MGRGRGGNRRGTGCQFILLPHRRSSGSYEILTPPRPGDRARTQPPRFLIRSGLRCLHVSFNGRAASGVRRLRFASAPAGEVRGLPRLVPGTRDLSGGRPSFSCSSLAEAQRHFHAWQSRSGGRRSGMRVLGKRHKFREGGAADVPRLLTDTSLI